MIVLPAIDLKDSKCVRLRKGAFDTAEKVAEDAVETAENFRAAGAVWVHMVDLDGARDGQRKNSDIVRAVCALPGIKVEMGGGIRSLADLETVFSLGVSRAIFGSAAVSDPELVRQAAALYGDRIAVGIDALGGTVRVSGWEKDSGLDACDFARYMEALGVRRIIYTDISRDGMLSGPSLEQISRLRRSVSCAITASGGVAVNADISALLRIPVEGAIVGKAYYAGTIDLRRAIEEAGVQC